MNKIFIHDVLISPFKWIWQDLKEMFLTETALSCCSFTVPGISDEDSH